MTATYHPTVIRRACRRWKVTAEKAAQMLDYQENRELETSEGELGFWTQSDNGPVWRRAVDTLA